MRRRGYGSILLPVILGFQVLGCGGLDPTIREQSSSDHAAVPPMTVERLRDCIKEHGEQLSPGSWAFSPKVKVDTEGYLVDVQPGAIPNTAPDFAACTREALGGMNVPSSILQLRPVASAGATNEPTREQRSYLGSPALVVVVVVGLSEVAFEAGAYTILFAVSVEVVNRAAKDVAEAAKKGKWFDKCVTHYTLCMATPVGDDLGNNWSTTVCGDCFWICKKEYSWPPAVANNSCEYWRRGWGH